MSDKPIVIYNYNNYNNTSNLSLVYNNYIYNYT